MTRCQIILLYLQLIFPNTSAILKFLNLTVIRVIFHFCLNGSGKVVISDFFVMCVSHCIRRVSYFTYREKNLSKPETGLNGTY